MRVRTLLVAIAAGLPVGGCSSPPPAQVTVSVVGTPQAGASLTSSLASVPVGVALELDVEPAESQDTVSVTADDPTLVLVAPMTVSPLFLVVGLAPGQTSLNVFVNGQETRALSVAGGSATTLSVAISPQPPPS
jgi:hypothetical protein